MACIELRHLPHINLTVTLPEIFITENVLCIVQDAVLKFPDCKSGWHVENDHILQVRKNSHKGRPRGVMVAH